MSGATRGSSRREPIQEHGYSSRRAMRSHDIARTSDESETWTRRACRGAYPGGDHPLAQPPLPPSGGLVTHNGSLMAVEVLPDGLVQIRYVDPRPNMRAFVVPGVLLVEGRWI